MPLRFGRRAPEYERQDAVELAEQAVGGHLTPAEVSRYWSRRASDFIAAEPGRWIALLGRKLVLLWNRTEVPDTESQETYAEWSWPVRFVTWAGNFGVLAPLAVVGLWLTWPERHRLVVIYATTAAYAASVVMFCVFARYRFPLVPFLVLFASAGIVSLRRFVRTEPFRKKASALASVAAVAICANWPLLSAVTLEAVTETNLAVALQEQGRFDDAIAHYRRAIAIKADYAPAYNNMGVALQAKGQMEEAVATYQRAIALRSDFPDAHYNLAAAFLKESRPDQAVDQLRIAMLLLPGSVEVRNNLGIALMAEGKPDEAVAQFRRVLEIDPWSAKGQRNLADALARQGGQAEAIEHFRLAVQLDPGSGALHYDLASVLLETGRLSEAVDEFRAAVALTPHSSAAHNNLGIALGSQGKVDEAIDQFEQALRFEPQLAEARTNLRLALQARERPGPSPR